MKAIAIQSAHKAPRDTLGSLMPFFIGLTLTGIPMAALIAWILY